MKQRISIVLCFALLLALAGCGSGVESGSVRAVLNARMTEDAALTTECEQQLASEGAEPPLEEIPETAEAVTEALTASEQELALRSESADGTDYPTAASADVPESVSPQNETTPVTPAEETDLPDETEPAAEETEPPAQDNGYADVDIDLTMFSATVAISQLYNMLVDPTPYIGYVVRVSGIFIVYSDGARACLISDEGGCCQEGVHISLRQGFSYPAEGTPVTVVGTFGTYYINDILYCIICDAVLE